MDESLAESRTLGKPTGANGTTPVISVVVATHNRADRLKKLLRSLDEQTVSPADFEVIVVDDGSTDETGQLLSENRTAIVIRTSSQRGRLEQDKRAGRPRAASSSPSQMTTAERIAAGWSFYLRRTAPTPV